MSFDYDPRHDESARGNGAATRHECSLTLPRTDDALGSRGLESGTRVICRMAKDEE